MRSWSSQNLPYMITPSWLANAHPILSIACASSATTFLNNPPANRDTPVTTDDNRRLRPPLRFRYRGRMALSRNFFSVESLTSYLMRLYDRANNVNNDKENINVLFSNFHWKSEIWIYLKRLKKGLNWACKKCYLMKNLQRIHNVNI